MKKLIISLVLAALMTLVLAVPAFAGGRGSVVTGNGRCQVLANGQTDVGGLHTAHNLSPAVYQDCP